MRKSISAAVFAALVFTPTLVAGKENAVIPLARTGNWEINYDEDSCHLYGKFGEGDNLVILAITRSSPSDWEELALYGKATKFDGIDAPIELSFGDKGQPTKYIGLAVTLNGKFKLPGVIAQLVRLDGWQMPAKPNGAITVPKLTSEVEASVTSITFKVAGGKRVRLETGSMAAPMAAMRACTDDLLVHWGIDPAVHKGISRQPSPAVNPVNWLGANDFPNKAILNGHNGFVRFRLIVEADGTVSGCRVLYRTNPDDFADLSCNLMMKRAKMNPALDANGNPVRSFYVSQIKWKAGDW